MGAERQQKVDRPGIIGCNILSTVGNTLAAELVPTYLESIQVDGTGSQWARVLMLVASRGVNMKQRHVGLAGSEPQKLPAGYAVTVLGHVVKPIGVFQMLVQPSDPESGGLPRGVQTLCSVAMTDQSCVQGGVIPVQILNLKEEMKRLRK